MNQDAKSAQRTKGQIEAEISEAIIKFEKEYMGRGPTGTKTHIIDDLVLVRLKGILTPAEYQLAKAENSPKARELIKQVRHELLERGRPLLEAVIHDLTGQKTVSRVAFSCLEVVEVPPLFEAMYGCAQEMKSSEVAAAVP